MNPFAPLFLEPPTWLESGPATTRTEPAGLNRSSQTRFMLRVTRTTVTTLTFAMTLGLGSGFATGSTQVTASAMASSTTAGLGDGAVHPMRVLLRAPSQLEIAWEWYLRGLETPPANGGFKSDQLAAVRTVWKQFTTWNSTLVPPQTAPTESRALSMVWNSGVHHLEVDVDPESKVSWFYTNRKTDAVEGRENHRPANLPPRLREIVALLNG